MTGTQKFETLKHTRRPLSGGGKIVVIDTGALIDAEELAMLQALHSRSLGGVDSHLLKLAQKGAQNFMDTYYVGYGDKSIGDCGPATIFIEGVSMLVAKAIQDHQLYNGQEASTRYIDFAKQPFANPAGTAGGTELLESLRAFHLKGLGVLKDKLAGDNPWDPASKETEKEWWKAINARAFDVMRSFLPAGAATNLAWHTKLRHANDHLLRLRHHPLQEVRDVAEAISDALNEKYPHSGFAKRYEKTEGYTAYWMKESYYYDEHPWAKGFCPEARLDRDALDYKLLDSLQHFAVLSHRPLKTELPKYFAECGTMRFTFLLDFGSFRDIQRHRAVMQRMPLLTDRRYFGSWYLKQMPEDLRAEANALLFKWFEKDGKIESFRLSKELKQYYIPMGYQVACRLTGDLPALVWLVELRSGIAVHPTLRVVAQNIAAIMREKVGPRLELYIDKSPDRFNVKRGLHDIVEKVPAAT